MKQGILLLVLLLFSACTFTYDEDEFIFTQPQITVNTSLSGSYGGRLDVFSRLYNAENLKIDRIGHCYIFDSETIPDTSSLVVESILADPQVYLGYYFGNIIDFTDQNKFIYVRGFIQFSDSIIYPDTQFKSLNE